MWRVQSEIEETSSKSDSFLYEKIQKKYVELVWNVISRGTDRHEVTMRRSERWRRHTIRLDEEYLSVGSLESEKPPLICLVRADQRPTATLSN